MAIRIQNNTLIVPKDRLDRVPGLVDELVRMHPHAWSDEHLWAFGAKQASYEMVALLKAKGLKQLETRDGAHTAVDFCIVEDDRGPTLPCAWLDVDMTGPTAWKKGTAPGMVADPPSQATTTRDADTTISPRTQRAATALRDVLSEAYGADWMHFTEVVVSRSLVGAKDSALAVIEREAGVSYVYFARLPEAAVPLLDALADAITAGSAASVEVAFVTLAIGDAPIHVRVLDQAPKHPGVPGLLAEIVQRRRPDAVVAKGKPRGAALTSTTPRVVAGTTAPATTPAVATTYAVAPALRDIEPSPTGFVLPPEAPRYRTIRITGLVLALLVPPLVFALSGGAGSEPLGAFMAHALAPSLSKLVILGALALQLYRLARPAHARARTIVLYREGWDPQAEWMRVLGGVVAAALSVIAVSMPGNTYVPLDGFDTMFLVDPLLALVVLYAFAGGACTVIDGEARRLTHFGWIPSRRPFSALTGTGHLFTRVVREGRSAGELHHLGVFARGAAPLRLHRVGSAAEAAQLALRVESVTGLPVASALDSKR